MAKNDLLPELVGLLTGLGAAAGYGYLVGKGRNKTWQLGASTFVGSVLGFAGRSMMTSGDKGQQGTGKYMKSMGDSLALGTGALMVAHGVRNMTNPNAAARAEFERLRTRLYHEAKKQLKEGVDDPNLETYVAQYERETLQMGAWSGGVLNALERET